MKKVKILFSSITMFLLIVGMGCEKENNKKLILPMDDVSNQINSFFETNLPTIAESECFFKSKNGDIYYLINNKNELSDIFLCNSSLPDINFSEYSLIIGQKHFTSSFYKVIEQNITESDKWLDLNIYVRLLSDTSWPSFSKMYYWGIYPKLSSKKINVNVTIK